MNRVRVRSLFIPSLVAACALAACAGRPTPEPVGMSVVPVPHLVVDTLSATYWDAIMAVSPTWASYRGDRSRDAELPDVSMAGRLRHDIVLEGILREARAVDTEGLDDRRQMILQTLIERLEIHFEDEEHCERHFWEVDQLAGPQSWLGELPSYHVVDNAQRAQDLVTRYRAIPTLFDQHIANLNAGANAGNTAARINVTRVIAQLDRMAATPLAADPYLTRPLAQAAALPPAVYTVFEADVRRAVEESVRPALARYRAFLVETILPVSRTQPGISGLPAGADCYRASIARHTGLDLSPDAIHQIGLDEVARISAAMDTLAKEMGHSDTAAALAALAADPEQVVADEAALLDYNRALLVRARAELPKVFGRIPKIPVELKAIEPFRAPDAPAAYYYRAPDDGSRPAFYYLNTHRPETRLLYKMPALAWHEAIPGHHLQVALAQEAEALPAFMQNTGFTAFTEGWALYTEILADEMGLYRTPAERMGAYTYEIWRAARLVIDTGLHAKGWTRQQAIDYLQRHTGHIEEEVINEIDRYIAWPGQALAYKLGQLELSKMRAEAEATLGPAFHLSDWHDEVLRAGAIPLRVLRARMTAWTNARQTLSP